jgi:hypothetical protein
MWRARTGLAVLLALGCAVARSDDASKAPSDPDAGFLEFLGSVDRLADVNPDYLSQAGAAKVARPPVKPAPPPPPPAPQPQPQPLPPSASAASGISGVAP